MPDPAREPVDVSPDAAEKALKKGEPVKFALIKNKIDFNDRVFRRPVCFLGCKFEDELDFTRCKFERGVSFVGCLFKGKVSFEAALVNGDLQFRAARFKNELNCDRLRVNGKLEVRAPKPSELENFPEFLEHPFVTFEQEARFSQIQILGEANFGSAQFLRWADFYNASIIGSALFRIDRFKTYPDQTSKPEFDFKFPPVRFYHGVRFRQSRIGGELNLFGAQFWGTADFSYLRVLGPAFFSNPERRESRRSSKFRNNCETPTRFHSRPVWSVGSKEPHKCSQENSREHSNTKAQPNAPQLALGCQIVLESSSGPPGDPPVYVLEMGDCCSEVIENADAFLSLKLHVDESKETKEFWSQELQCRADFAGAQFDTLLDLSAAEFCVDASFEDCSYGRIQLRQAGEGPDYCYFMNVLNRADEARGRFERTSWLQFESVVRKMGDAENGDEIYRRRMDQETKYEKSWFRKKARFLWWLISGYGTWSWLIFVWCIVVIALGIGFFLHANAAVYSPRNEQVPASEVQFSCNSGFSGSCLLSALAISVQQFTPVTLPVAEEWKPHGGWTRAFAALEKILGWILVPLLVGNLAGLLHRRAKTDKEAEANDD